MSFEPAGKANPEGEAMTINIGEPKWLKDCEICNDGFSAAMRKFMNKHSMSQRHVAKLMAEQIEKRTGIRLYSAGALRKRCQRHENKLGRGVPLTKRKSSTVGTVVPSPKSEPDTFQKLLRHANALAEGLQHWADGTVKPKSEQEIKAAQGVKDAATELITQYARLDVDVVGIYKTKSQYPVNKTEGTHGLD